MNVFVTGGAGYIGSVCVEELLNAGHHVTVYDNLSEGHRSAVDSRARFVRATSDSSAGGGISDAMRDAKPQAVVHFAANALVGESMTNPSKYFSNNVCWGLKLLDAAIAAGVTKFVFSSTCATYGPPDRVPMTEDLPQRPINPYGDSKLMFEKMLNWYHQIHGLERGTGHVIGVHRHQQEIVPVLGQRDSGRRPIRRQQVMRFVHHQPVWPPSANPQLLKVRKQAGKKCRPVRDGQAQQVQHDVLFRLLHKLYDFLLARHVIITAQNHRPFQVFVIPFRVE